MRAKSWVMTLMVFGLFTMFSFAKVGDDEIVGLWKYKVSDVPPEYETGIMKFEQKNDKTVGYIGEDVARRSEMKELTMKENKISFKLTFESSQIVVNLVKDGDKMVGKVKTDDGEFPITVEKVVKKSTLR